MYLLKKLKQLAHFLLALAAYWLYGRPARHLIVIGVTGTKGKSTTCRLIVSVLEAGGYKVGLLSTVEFQIGEKRWLNDRKMTMLGRGEIQKMLRQMVEAGCHYAVVETSSEGILQYRHYGLLYDIAVFTNLGTEHSERHGGFENLKRDKGKLFAALGRHSQKTINGERIKKIIVVNADDKNAWYYLNFAADEKWEFSLGQAPLQAASCKLQATISEVLKNGTYFAAQGSPYHLNIVGNFNVYNGLAAVAVGLSQGIATDRIAAGLDNVVVVPGRMEFIDEGQNFRVVVDYAHEPISLSALFTSLRQMLSGAGGKLIAVVGSDGGGRDVQKRTRMGEIAGNLCDHVVISDVNCFDEDPGAIAEMLARGSRQAGKLDGVNLFIIVDRREGIRKALTLAQSGDVVVITAKGTEPCIMVAGGQKIPWDDRQVARELLHELRPTSARSPAATAGAKPAKVV